MHWDLIVDKAVTKKLKRLPQKDADRLFSIIQELTVNPYAGDIEKMEGVSDVWRRRIGSYRIFYEVSTAKKFIHVFDLKRRTSTTY